LFFLNLKFVLTIPLLYLFNLSLSTGTFPSVWKKSFIMPIFKGGDVASVTNYSPICLLSIRYSKNLRIYFIKKKLLHCSLHQHGFISEKPTTSNNLIIQK